MTNREHLMSSLEEMSTDAILYPNREHLMSSLEEMSTDAILYLNREFGCRGMSTEECLKPVNCIECWKHWLESEVK